MTGESRPQQQLWLVRHGETEWSLSGAHTGRTDIPLTSRGRAKALALRSYLASHDFSAVLSSPLARAAETCRLAGFGDRARPDPNLLEWDYGVFEGQKTEDIRVEQGPDWSIWSARVEGGESLDDVGARAEAVLAEVSQVPGNILMFAHGHIFRVLTAVWLGLPYQGGRLLALDPGGLSILGFERETRVIRVWNRAVDEI